MGCFTFGWFISVLIWLIIVCAVVAIIRLVLPMVLSQLGPPGNIILQILNIVLYAIILIFIVVFAGEMIECLVGMGGFGFPHIGRG